MRTIHSAACGAALLLGVLVTGAHADDLDFLLQEFAVVAERVDDRGLEEQGALLNKIADLDTKRARKKLLGLRKTWAGMNWRRDVMILTALVRRGDPDDIDAAIKWVEKTERNRKGPKLVLWSLSDVLAGARVNAARAHLRGKALKSAPLDIRIQIIRSLAKSKDVEAVPALIQTLSESHPLLRLEAIMALGELGDARAAAPLEGLLEKGDARNRAFAAEALGRVGTEAAPPALCAALQDKDPRVVEAAAFALAGLGGPTCMEGLIAAMDRLFPHELRAADACADALEQISGKPFGHDARAWTDWWEAVKDRPFVRDETDPSERTVPGLPYYGFRIRSSRVVFILDVSKSMEWNERLESAKRELTKVVESLPKTMRFNLITFSDGVDDWQDQIEPAEPRFIKKAVKFIERLTPQRATNTHAALELALREPKDARSDQIPDTILLLSDGSPSTGEVSDPDAILAQVREWNRYRRVKILCIALLTGHPPGDFRGQEDAEQAESFMRRLAEENGGRVEVIR